MKVAGAVGNREAPISIAHVVYFTFLGVATYFSPRLGGLELNSIIDVWNIWALPFSIVVILVLAAFAGHDRIPSVIFLHLILLTLVTPSLLLFVSGGLPWSFAVTTVAAFIIVALPVKFLPAPPLWEGWISSRALMWLCFIGAVVYAGSIAAFGGYKYINFNPWKVYQLRDAAADSLPSVFNYATPIVTGVVIPIAAALAAKHRAWWMMAAMIGLGVLLFGLTAHKAVAAYAVASIIFYWLATRRRPIEAMIAFLVAGIVASCVDLFLSNYTESVGGYGPGLFSTLFVRRFLLVPSILDWAYLKEFGEIGQYYWWSTSRITMGLVQSQFNVNPPHFIGLAYFSDPTLSANAGWIASGFANASYLGVFLYSIAFGSILWGMDVLGRRIGTPIVVGAMTLTVWKLATTSDLLTTFLTHGLLLAAILLSLAQNESSSRSEDT